MAMVGAYGVRIYPFGVEFRTDGRLRARLPGGRRIIERMPKSWTGCRKKIRAYSRASAKSLAMLVANLGVEFKTFITLTYRGTLKEGEDEACRNQRIVRGSKADLHRFIVCLGQEIGRYVWVQEFQVRGVLHYHLLCENRVSRERAAEVWLRAIGALGDAAAWDHGVKADPIRGQRQVRRYLGDYLVKARAEVLAPGKPGRRGSKAVQKELPKGVDGAGRWWGASRSIKPVIREEVISSYKEDGWVRYAELQTVRCLRRYVRKAMSWRFRSGAFLDWGGELCDKLVPMVARLREGFGVTPRVAELVSWKGAFWAEEYWDEQESKGNAGGTGGTEPPESRDGGGEAGQGRIDERGGEPEALRG